jgi:hypothetical protein
MIYRITLLLTITIITQGCSITRDTKTERSALEQALISTAAEQAISQLQIAKLKPRTGFVNKTYHIDSTNFKGADTEFAIAALNDKLLTQKMRVGKADEADIILHTRAGYAATDESIFRIGIPPIPVPLPGTSGLVLPELNLFKKHRADGKYRLGVTAVGRESGELVFRHPDLRGQKHYTKWTVLLIISWRSTDLPEPF